ncbi:metal ABC transporter substrate-binding protein [Oscillochloris sp. ZM17-4]|uniref:metal ABC transporter substrate-binding protein n=1 Tax=Oscillochloris sp. ZM17-4 TaxID=2866714 RepID=UPI00210782BB|nr:metal ABC transporter substrate-binding protein [Oscillochloris sp. ZM17-4]
MLAIAALALGACGQTPAQPAGDRPRVVASTSIVADVVRQIGGDKIALSTLVPVGTDAHSFAPAPQDVVTISEAQIVFVNGAGYEAFLEPLLKSAGGSAELIELAKGITLREMSAQELAADDDHADEGHADEAGHDHSGDDPHTWTDPNNVKYWTSAISESLSRIDPTNAGFYAANAEAYNIKLSELDAWAAQEFATIPPAQRLLVTDHAVFGYLADRYGLTQVGTIIPGGSSAAEASAQDLAALQDQIRSLGVKAIFVGNVSNPSMAERLAQDTGVKLVTVLTESLTPPDGPGATYIDYMRSNVSTIVGALR